MRSVLQDFGLNAEILIRSDATAAIGIVHRLGLGKVRHLATSDLWIQQHVRMGLLRIEKLDGKSNPADAFTKHLPGHDLLAKALRLNWMLSSGSTPASSSDAAAE